MTEISRRRFIGGAAAVGAGWIVLGQSREAAAVEGEWLAGDLHCHTVFSHDVWAGPGDDNTDTEDFYTLGWTPAEQILIAESRQLDFLAITDHNDVRALTDPGYRSPSVVLIPGYEHSLSHGHAGCLGVNRFFTGFNTSEDAGALALRDAVHAAGGIFILNHPFYGSGWGYAPAVRPDSIEVWNISWPYRRELLPVVSTSNNYLSLPYWEKDFLDAGPMPATGGSDNHWRSTTAVQGVGQPTTWVYAADRGVPAILEGIRAGRTTVSHGPRSLGGPQLFLTGERGAESWMVGDTVAGGTSVDFTVRVARGTGYLLRFVVDGVDGSEIPVTLPDFTASISLAPAEHRRIRAELYADRGWWMAALTSPIYMGD